MDRLWVARLTISEATARKIQGRHHLDAQEIRDVIVCRAGLYYVWDRSPERGTRALVRTFVRGNEVVAVLYRSASGEPDAYNLGSAYRTGK